MVDSMPQEQPRGAATFLLSRSELQAILTLAEIAVFPGFSSEDPIGDLAPEQEAYGIICGERALRARGQAFVDEQGELRIQNQLLEAIGVCAYASNMLVITRFPVGEKIGSRFVVYHLDDHYVSLFLPENMLFLFTVYGGRQQVVEDICRLCASKEVTNTSETFIISEASLAQLRQIVDADTITLAEKILKQEHIDERLGQAFLSLLRNPYELIILQAVKSIGDDELSIQTTLIFHDGDYSWGVYEQELTEENDQKSFVVSRLQLADSLETIMDMHW